MRLEPDKDSPEIYVILRVYNLTSDNIGIRILVDPATLEQEDKLLFEAENYTVLQKDVPQRMAGERSLNMPSLIRNRSSHYTDQEESPI